MSPATDDHDDGENDNVPSLQEGWPEEGMTLVVAPRKHAPGLNSLLRWAFERGASRIAFSTAKPVTIRVHGRNITVTREALDDADISLVTNHLYGADGTARLQNGSDFDVAYEISISRMTRLRFRVNATPIRTSRYFGVNLASSDLDETFASLESSGAEVVQEPTDQPYGVRDCAFRDPAGNMLRIQQNRS